MTTLKSLDALIRDLDCEQTRRVVHALQELWVEHGAFGDCVVTEENLVWVMIKELAVMEESFKPLGENGTGKPVPDEQGQPLSPSSIDFKARDRGSLKMNRGEELGQARRNSDHLETLDQEPFTERAEELLLLLLNELHRDRIRWGLQRVRWQRRSAPGLTASKEMKTSFLLPEASISSTLSTYTAILLRSERSKARMLAFLLLSRMPYVMVAKVVALDGGRMVDTLLREHSFLRRAAAKGIGHILFILLHRRGMAYQSQKENLDERYLDVLRADQNFMRTLFLLFRGLCLALEDEDDEIFSTALESIARFVTTSNDITPYPSDAFALHCFNILDRVGVSLVERFRRIQKSELKADVMIHLADLVALSLVRNEEDFERSRRTMNENVSRTFSRRTSSSDSTHTGIWAVDFLRNSLAPLLHSESNMVRLNRDLRAKQGEFEDLVYDVTAPLDLKTGSEKSEDFDYVLWFAAVRAMLVLLSYPHTETSRVILRAALPVLQNALTKEDRDSAFASSHLRCILLASGKLLEHREDHFFFLSRQLQMWSRIPRACQTRSNLMLLVSMLMGLCYGASEDNSKITVDLLASKPIPVDVERVCRVLFPPLRRNLIDDHLVLESDWNRSRDVLFCVLLRIWTALRSCLVTPKRALKKQLYTATNCTTPDTLSLTADPDLIIRVSIRFLTYAREQIFRYHGFSIRYGDAIASLTGLCAELAFFLKDCSDSTRSAATLFLMETVRDCSIYRASPTSLKLFSRGVCRALPLTPPYEGENTLYEMLVHFLAEAVPQATALPATRRAWRSVSGILRFSSLTSGGAGAEQEANKLWLMLDNDFMNENAVPLRDESERETSAGGFDSEDAIQEAKPAQNERVVSAIKVVSEATSLLYEHSSAMEFEEHARQANLELIASVFEIQKRFPGTNSQKLRQYVQQAGSIVTALEESTARTLRDHVFLDVVNTTDSQLRFLRTGDYSKPESRDALMARIAKNHASDLKSFAVLNEGTRRPLVSAHVTDALVDTVRSLLVHQEALIDCLSDWEVEYDTNANPALSSQFLEWLNENPWTQSIMIFRELLLPSKIAAEMDGLGAGVPSVLTQPDAPVLVQATHKIDAHRGVVELDVSVQFKDNVDGIADISIGYEGDADDNADSDDETQEKKMRNSQKDTGWLEISEEYDTRILTRESTRMVARLPLRRGALHVSPLRVRVNWLSEKRSSSSEKPTDSEKEYSSKLKPWWAADAGERWLLPRLVDGTSLPMKRIPTESFHIDERSLLLLQPTAKNVVELDFFYALWDLCQHRQTAVIAVDQDALFPGTRVAPSVKAICSLLCGALGFQIITSAPSKQPQRAMLYARSRAHCCSALIRIDTSYSQKDEKQISGREWLLMNLRCEQAAFLSSLCSHLFNSLRRLEPPLEVRKQNDVVESA